LGMAVSGVRHPVSLLSAVVLLTFALTALRPLRFHLSALLFDLRLLFGCQHSLHFLTHLELFTHELSLKTCGLSQLLSGQSFIERTALAGLTQLLTLGAEFLMQRLGALAEAFA